MESDNCKLCFVQTRDRIKDRKNLESEANNTVKEYLVALTHRIAGVNEETAARHYQIGYLCGRCSNLARKVIKLEDELQKLSSELKQSISGLNLHQSTQSSSEDQPSQCNSAAQVQSHLIQRKRGPRAYKPPAKRLNFEQNPESSAKVAVSLLILMHGGHDYIMVSTTGLH